MATVPLKYLNQYITTTLSVVGGIDASQTTGIVIQSPTGLETTKPGVALFSYSDPLNTTNAEWITYTAITANELQGVTRGAEGGTGKVHANGVTIAFPLSESHINNLNAMFDTTGLDIAQIATPSNPDSGRNKLYFKSDGKVYKLTSGGVESEVGSSILNTTSYAPEGFLVNGKIVPSVSSNNLTIAIKGMDGNDPSSTNPVYIRIGSTVRTITAALSVTKNAGTNWCNAGSSELATKEVDYFVYLGYNATDGVVVGFSRIPYANIYSDFSATSTNEKYAGISTITNASAGDNYVLVGRFAATLSAGAGYTWTIPTFTNANLIQKPIYNTRWLDYVPTVSFTAGTAPTTLDTTSSIRRYCITDRGCQISLFSIYSSAGSTVTASTHTLPIAMDQTAGLPTSGGQSVAAGLTPILSMSQPSGTSIGIWNSSASVDRVGYTGHYPII